MSATPRALLGPLIALIPGFVLVTVYRRNRHGADPSDARFVASSLVASIVPHAIVLPWTLRLVARTQASPHHAPEIVAWLALLTLIVPTTLGLAFSWLVELDRMDRLLGHIGWSIEARTRSAWEWAIAPAEPSWILVTMKNGQLIGGRFSTGSFASLDPDRRDIFLREPYEILDDGDFGEPMEESLGTWIEGSDILTVDFYQGDW